MRAVGVGLVFACLCISAAPLSDGSSDGRKTRDITTYGAIAGDGKDDAGAINSAIAAAGDGDTVRIGEGVWELGSSVTCRSNVNVVGAGNDRTRLKCIAKTTISLIQLKDVQNIVISKLTLDGNNSMNAMHGIEAEKCSRLNLNNLRVQNLGAISGFGPHGIYFSTTVTDSNISNCAFVSIGSSSEWGAAIRLSHGSSFNSITKCTIEKTGRGGILADNSSTDLVIRSNEINGSGLANNGNGYGLGIELWGGSHRSVVEDNKLDHWLSVDSSRQVAVRRNVISDASGPHKWAGLELVDSEDCVFTDNTVDGGAKVGISISGREPKQRIYFGHNTIKHPSTWGAQVQGEAGKASRLYFYKNGFTGAVKNGPHTMYGPQGNGFRFNGGVEDIVLDSNIISGNEGAGIQIAGANISELSFVNNQITDNGGEAVDGAAKGSLWMNNLVTNNGRNSALISPPPKTKLPTATIQQKGNLLAGEEIHFTATLADAGPVSTILWDFGDGIPDTRSQPVHRFAAGGSYRVTVVVWDSSGRGAICEKSIDIAPSGPLATPATPELRSDLESDVFEDF